MLILAHNSRAYSNMAEKSGGRSSRQSVSHIAFCIGNLKRMNAGCNSAPFLLYTDLHAQICMQSKPGNRAAHSRQFSPLQLTQQGNHPTDTHKRLLFSVDDGDPEGCEMIGWYSQRLHFQMISRSWAFFPACCPFVHLLWRKVSSQVIHPV